MMTLEDVWILDRTPPLEDSLVLREIFETQGVSVGVVDFDSLHFGSSQDLMKRPKVALFSSRILTRASATFRSNMFGTLESFASGGTVLLNRMVESSYDKLQCYAALEKSGHPTLPWRLARTRQDLDQAVADFGAIVIKPRFSHAAMDMLIVSSIPEVPGAKLAGQTESIVWNLFERHGDFVVQQVLPQPHDEYRCAVVSNEFMWALKRKLGPGQHSAIGAVGGGGYESANISAAAQHKVVQSVNALGLDFAEVDLLHQEGKYFVVDVNPALNARLFHRYSDLSDPYVALRRVVDSVIKDHLTAY